MGKIGGRYGSWMKHLVLRRKIPPANVKSVSRSAIRERSKIVRMPVKKVKTTSDEPGYYKYARRMIDNLQQIQKIIGIIVKVDDV